MACGATKQQVLLRVNIRGRGFVSEEKGKGAATCMPLCRTCVVLHVKPCFN